MFPIKVIVEIKTHISCSVTFFPENRAVYEKIWKNIVEWGKPQMTIWRKRIACWITKATNTHSQYAILITFSLQQQLHERASMLRYTLQCLSCLKTSHILNAYESEYSISLKRVCNTRHTIQRDFSR